MAQDSKEASTIDERSMAEYKQEYETFAEQNKNASKAESVSHLESYIKQKIGGMMEKESGKHSMDISTVALATGFNMAIPFAGLAVVVAATTIQCLSFAITLGLIPVELNLNILYNLSKQVGTRLKGCDGQLVASAGPGLVGALESSVLHVLEEMGLAMDFLEDVLKDILMELVGEAAAEAAWIFSPMLAMDRYTKRGKLMKKMYSKLGDRAIVVHMTWVKHNISFRHAVDVKTVGVTLRLQRWGSVHFYVTTLCACFVCLLSLLVYLYIN